jgi:hypothetical protein
MKSFHLAGAAALCAALAFTGCAKETGQSTPAADSAATTAPVVAAGPGGYIVIPVYPGATARKDDADAMNRYGPSVAVTIYSSKDDSRRVADWYFAHLPSSWRTSVARSDGKTRGGFSEEHKNGGYQSVIVESRPDRTTQIEIATKHGK